MIDEVRSHCTAHSSPGSTMMLKNLWATITGSEAWSGSCEHCNTPLVSRNGYISFISSAYGTLANSLLMFILSTAHQGPCLRQVVCVLQSRRPTGTAGAHVERFLLRRCEARPPQTWQTWRRWAKERGQNTPWCHRTAQNTVSPWALASELCKQKPTRQQLFKLALIRQLCKPRHTQTLFWYTSLNFMDAKTSETKENHCISHRILHGNASQPMSWKSR